MSALHFMIEFFRSRQSDDEGATAVEYALLIGLIIIAIATLVGTLGTKMATIFTNVTAAI